MRTTFLLLAILPTIASGTTIQMSGPVTYTGPDSPLGGPWNGQVTAKFDTTFDQVAVQFESNSPSGDIDVVLDWGGLDEATKKYFSDPDTGAHQMTLITSTGDWNSDTLTNDNFESLVDSISYEWFDPQFNTLGNFQTQLTLHPPDYQVLAVPEPGAFVLAGIGLLLLSCRRLVSLLTKPLPLTLLMFSVLAMIASQSAVCDDQHPHTHPEFDTPIGISQWMHTDDLDLAIASGPTLHVRDDGSLKMYSQQEIGGRLTWFYKDLIWRWKVASEGPFSESCVYVPDGDMCTTDFYGLVGGKPLTNPDGSLRAMQKYINYVQERPGYLPVDVAQDTDLLIDNMWFDWKSAEMVRGPNGNSISLAGEALGADSLILVSNNPPTVVPEPTSVGLFVAGLVTLLFLRKAGDQR